MQWNQSFVTSNKCKGHKYVSVNNTLKFLQQHMAQNHLLTYLISYSMEQNPSREANRFSASQEIPRILWNPKVHYRIHTCTPPVSILSQLDPVHATTSLFLKIHLNIILPSKPGSSKWSFPFRFSHHNTVYASLLPRTCYMLCQSYFSRFFNLSNIEWGVQIIKLLIT